MRGSPAVSVVIPTHNCASTLGRAIDSVLAQTRRPEEIIIVDDESTDNIQQAIARFPGEMIRVVPTGKRRGAGGARNVGISVAKGDLIAFLDADDEWLPRKLEKQVDMLDADSRLWFVTCGSNSISPTGVDIGDTYGGARIAAGSEAWKALLACNFIATPSVIAWRKRLESVGGFDESMKIGEDQDMWIRLSLGGLLGYVPDVLVRVHLRQDSLSKWVLGDLLTYTLPMVERHISEQRHRLTDAEIRKILGERLNRFGRVAYVRGEVPVGFRLVARSMLLGYRPLESAAYLLRAAPPLAWLKRQVGIGSAG